MTLLSLLAAAAWACCLPSVRTWEVLAPGSVARDGAIYAVFQGEWTDAALAERAFEVRIVDAHGVEVPVTRVRTGNAVVFGPVRGFEPGATYELQQLSWYVDGGFWPDRGDFERPAGVGEWFPVVHFAAEQVPPPAAPTLVDANGWSFGGGARFAVSAEVPPEAAGGVVDLEVRRVGVVATAAALPGQVTLDASDTGCGERVPVPHGPADVRVVLRSPAGSVASDWVTVAPVATGVSSVTQDADGAVALAQHTVLTGSTPVASVAPPRAGGPCATLSAEPIVPRGPILWDGIGTWAGHAAWVVPDRIDWKPGFVPVQEPARLARDGVPDVPVDVGATDGLAAAFDDTRAYLAWAPRSGGTTEVAAWTADGREVWRTALSPPAEGASNDRFRLQAHGGRVLVAREPGWTRGPPDRPFVDHGPVPYLLTVLDAATGAPVWSGVAPFRGGHAPMARLTVDPVVGADGWVFARGAVVSTLPWDGGDFGAETLDLGPRATHVALAFPPEGRVVAWNDGRAIRARVPAAPRSSSTRTRAWTRSLR